MKNIIGKAFWGGWGQRLDNNGGVLRSAGVNASLPLYDEFKAKNRSTEI